MIMKSELVHFARQSPYIKFFNLFIHEFAHVIHVITFLCSRVWLLDSKDTIESFLKFCKKL